MARMPHLSSECVLQVVLAIVLFVYSGHYTARVENKVDMIAEAQAQEKTLGEIKELLLNRSQQAGQSAPKYLAKSTVKARRTLKSGSHTVGTIYVDRIVDFIEDRGRKLKVRYFDYQA